MGAIALFFHFMTRPAIEAFEIFIFFGNFGGFWCSAVWGGTEKTKGHGIIVPGAGATPPYISGRNLGVH